MVAHFYPETVYTIVTQPFLNTLMLPFQHNLILNLPIEIFCQWLAHNRLGTFVMKNDDILFMPGIHRRDIYSPIIETCPIFELAAQMQEHNIYHHFQFLQLLMQYRSNFINFMTQNTTSEKCEVLFFQELKRVKPISRSFKVRVKRKNRPSKNSTNIDAEFFAFLTQKGHYNWFLL